MPIYKGTLKTGAAYKGATPLIRIYKGAYLVFEAFKILIAEGVPPLTLLNCALENMLGYKVYGDASQSTTPSPTDPVEIEAVGDKTYNLWPNSGTNYGWILTDGTRSTSQGVGRRIVVEVGKTYNYVSSKEADGHFYNCIAQYDENMNFISDSRVNITNSQRTKINSVTITNSSTKYLVCSYYTISPYGAPDTNMITEGATIPEYKPYGYEIPITVSGVNVFNKDGAEKSGCTLSGYTFTATGSNANIDIKIPAGTYTISCSNNQTIYLRNGKVTSGTITSKTSSQSSVTFNFTGSVDGYLRISFFGGSVSNIQIQSGSSPTAFEDYFAPVTYSTYMTYPLYKLGNSVDYIDFERQKVIRNNRPVTLTGSEPFSPTTLTVTGYFTCIQYRSDRASTYQSTLSTHFRYIGSSTTDNGLFFGGSNNNFIYFRINQSYGVTSTDTFKAWLTGQYNDGTPVVFVYPLANPLENTISAPDILLHKGTNIITVGTSKQPSNMWIKYKGKA